MEEDFIYQRRWTSEGGEASTEVEEDGMKNVEEDLIKEWRRI